MRLHGVARARLIATEACRSAENGEQFLAEVRERSGFNLENRRSRNRGASGRGRLRRARRTAPPSRSSCSTLAAARRRSSGWPAKRGPARRPGADATAQRIEAWESLRLGVVTLAEKFGGHEVSDEIFAAIGAIRRRSIGAFRCADGGQTRCAHFHLLGTSGTGETIAGVH